MFCLVGGCGGCELVGGGGGASCVCCCVVELSERMDGSMEDGMEKKTAKILRDWVALVTNIYWFYHLQPHVTNMNIHKTRYLHIR